MCWSSTMTTERYQISTYLLTTEHKPTTVIYTLLHAYDLFASIIVPLTLLAGNFSMGEDFRPGKPQSRKLWTTNPPACVTFAFVMVCGKRLWQLGIDIMKHPGSWLGHYARLGSKNDERAQKRANGGVQAHDEKKLV